MRKLVWVKFYIKRELENTIMTTFHIIEFLNLRIYFMELMIGYYFANFQCSGLSGSSFADENSKNNETPYVISYH